ncbi:hypothetical protein P152DRAFT_445007 [Eremomyces bilateralis CBS 781.70]|uniref:Uncharacterized protein n=1 Tax=Eremomyces bilateralis CBS 781.70 TaxID=1392243 RepID=A0A6G1GFD7_9PEZI|nr:uncharacterized protein P152DRAFT_445007 [Eremomyces bilateralis CBS 781.70]KAF1816825.1 hypothetical protein P152DRAFT_445007 [Eremomyces bilateralis CBS 781.70]
MAEQTTHDVLKEAKSVGEALPIDESATPTTTSDASNGKENLNPSIHGGDDNPSLGSDGAQNANSAASVPDSGIVVDGPPGSEVQTPDGTVRQVVVDVSGGSDTDTSRGDPSKSGEPHHVRSGSMKKPAAFKSVSVTKNFLAKTATATAPARIGEKGTSPAPNSTLQAAKPRLVAKSGSGLTGLSRVGKLNGVAAGPDASKVWNKNQPVPTPPPKQFTDEELKQQYGIHMATRLGADEVGKEAKWADIDDDEDDWAPETVEWMDGTKTSGAMPVSEPHPPPPPVVVEQKAMPLKDQTPLPAAQPVAQPATQPAPQFAAPAEKPTLSSTTKTILKPGSHSGSSGQKLALGGAGRSTTDQKPTLVAKPSVATVKSPWAALPPIEKASPVLVKPPMQQPQPRYPQEPQGYGAAPSAAKEIAADDFNRTWRTTDTGTKELYNSHSGRYEPVNDARRGSRHEHGGYRQTSVLQRSGGQGGPAEPSAAFQTSRSSGSEGQQWARHRTGSNVSGGSGPQGRRVSFTRPDFSRPDMSVGEMPGPMRRGSHAGSEVFMPGGTVRSPFMQHRVPYDRGVSPNNAASYASSSPTNSHVLPVAPVPGTESGQQSPSLSAVEQQKVLMRTKLEAARLAKQREREAEEREEAARKERLRLKLAALSPAHEVSDKDIVEAVKQVKDELVMEKQSQQVLPQPSPPKPPIPTAADGGVAQYGLMKVHQPHPVKKYSPSGSHVQPAAVNHAGTTGETIPWSPRRGQMATSPAKASAQPTHAPRLDTQGPQRAGMTDSGIRHMGPPAGETNSTNVGPAHGHTQAQSHASPAKVSSAQWTVGTSQNRPDLAVSWGDRSISSTLSSAHNVWGPPNRDNRSLGNGTFGASYSQIPSAPQSMRASIGNQSQRPHDNNGPFGQNQQPIAAYSQTSVDNRGESGYPDNSGGESGRKEASGFTFPAESSSGIKTPLPPNFPSSTSHSPTHTPSGEFQSTSVLATNFSDNLAPSASVSTSTSTSTNPHLVSNTSILPSQPSSTHPSTSFNDSQHQLTVPGEHSSSSQQTSSFVSPYISAKMPAGHSSSTKNAMASSGIRGWAAFAQHGHDAELAILPDQMKVLDAANLRRGQSNEDVDISSQVVFKQTTSSKPKTKSSRDTKPKETIIPAHLKPKPESQPRSGYKPPHLMEKPAAPTTITAPSPKPKAESRFFPATLTHGHSIKTTIELNGNGPAPDDQEHNHPVFDGATGGPRVKFPTPTPIVNLPGRNVKAANKNEAILNKINELLKHAEVKINPQTAAVAAVEPVAPSTKAQLEQVSDNDDTTVNLPVQKIDKGKEPEGHITLDDFLLFTEMVEKSPGLEASRWAVKPGNKPAAEEEVVEEPQFGSTPRIAPPRQSHNNARNHPGAPVVFAPQGRAPRPVASTTRAPREPSPNEDANGRFVRVSFNGNAARRITVNRSAAPLRSNANPTRPTNQNFQAARNGTGNSYPQPARAGPSNYTQAHAGPNNHFQGAHNGPNHYQAPHASPNNPYVAHNNANFAGPSHPAHQQMNGATVPGQPGNTNSTGGHPTRNWHYRGKRAGKAHQRGKRAREAAQTAADNN